MLIILINGLVWLRSSYGKMIGGKFVEDLGGTLGKFASKNPNPQVKDFLENMAIPNSQVFGMLTMWGEALISLLLMGGSLLLLFGQGSMKNLKPVLVLGLLGGMFLNAVFWLAAGWTSSSTDSVNLIMFATELIALVAVVNNSKG